ncbi:MBOAT family protein [Acanthamoeba castellanii str. Neff]|uniref:MBOAT family protein n=1 Tax=Acanthamoeba castellanii (strain ATCC 30010 / Neff) TaxID=1257118 RepID=L8GI83_ACACF|nr:MBOAT family protein [Acanthamoeba castellanii str. Neff]ELR12463.1 MBOAT family protein [Acanthamoeba castellanii str. Neff]
MEALLDPLSWWWVTEELLARRLGVKPEMVRYLTCLALVYPLALLHRQLPSTRARHLLALVAGLALAFANFGLDALHFVISATVPYILCALAPRQRLMPIAVFIFALAYISAGHLQRMYQSAALGGPVVHWTSPQMLLTVKISSFAWAYYDGHGRPAGELLPSQEQRAVRGGLPSLLHYYSYVFFFAGFLTGPIAEYREYAEFTDRSMFAKEKGGRIPGGSWKAGVARLGMALAAVPLFYLHQKFPETFATSPEFLEKSIWYRWLYVMVSSELGFDKYYVVFFLGEGAIMLSGLGYNGRDANGHVLWDRLLMLRLIPFKLAQDPSTLAANWNIVSANWLKRYVYVRLLPARTNVVADKAGAPLPPAKPVGFVRQIVPFFATFFVSAIWHAISNTTQVLTRLVDLLDNETTLVITSDHGHIDRGGHGGTHPQLKAIPLIVYQRGSGLGKGVKVDYPPAESDKSDLPEPKLPIGGSDGGGDDSANYEGAKRSAGDVDTDDDIVANQAATSTLTYGLSAERAQSNLAVVGTVCGLLGIPLPRQSLGLVVEEVIDHLLVADPHHREAVYRDLFLQKKALVYELLQVLDVDMGPLTATLNYSVSDTTTDDCMTSATTATPEARVECYKAKANHLLRAWYANRDDELEARVTRNVLINLGVTLVALGLVLGLVQRYSLANPRAIPAYVWRAGAVPLARRLIRAGRALARRGLRRPLTINGMGDGLSALEEVDDDGSVVVVAELNDAAERDTAGSEAAQDMQALLGSFVVVGTYYLINIVAVVLYCKQQGNDWDFTLWNFDVDAYLYLALIPVMSVFVFLILAHLHSFVVVYRTIRRLRAADCVHETALVLVYQLYPSSSLTPGGDHHQWPGGWKTSFRSTLRCSCSAAYQAAMVVERYLFAHYTLLVAVMGMVVIKALEGCYGVFLLPGMWRVVLLNDQTWDLRFRLIGVELMQAPLFGLALLQLGLLLYLPRFSASSALFDLLFTRRRRTCGAARHAHRSLPTQEEFAEDNNGSELVVDRFVADQAADDDDDNDNENENGTRGEEDDEEDEIESVPVDDLPALLARAASQVGRVASPIVFFEAQALQEMV